MKADDENPEDIPTPAEVVELDGGDEEVVEELGEVVGVPPPAVSSLVTR